MQETSAPVSYKALVLRSNIWAAIYGRCATEVMFSICLITEEMREMNDVKKMVPMDDGQLGGVS